MIFLVPRWWQQPMEDVDEEEEENEAATGVSSTMTKP
jgi:hypothetical protein